MIVRIGILLPLVFTLVSFALALVAAAHAMPFCHPALCV